MVQVDHVLVFDESIAKHEEYANGGQAYIDFKIQIIRTSDGELVYQDMQRYGAFYPYNTQIIYPSLNQSDINALRGLNFKQLFFKFGLALGMTRSGIIFKGKTKDVGMVLMGSPAHKAGIAAGDTITRVNGRSIKNIYDMDSFQKEFKIKQGDKIRVGYLREGIAREAVMEFPKILSYSVEKRKVIPKETTPAKKKMWDI
jgi:PDZ domain-containing secreted protein